MKIQIKNQKDEPDQSKKKTTKAKIEKAKQKLGVKKAVSAKKPKVPAQAASELRQDPVTGDWVVIATGRAKRPEDFVNKEKEIEPPGSGDCPFCGDGLKKQKPDTLIYYREDGEWSLKVFPNLYPAFTRSQKISDRENGLFYSMDGSGYHEVIITRDHDRSVPFLLKEEVAEVIDAFKTRYLELMNRKSVNYIMYIENHGKESGASLVHPHWQMFAIPVVSPAVNLELDGAELFYNERKACVYCAMIEQEIKDGNRVVAENDAFIAIAPFASRSAFEVWILPKNHQPYFERIKEQDEFKVAELLKTVIEKYYWNLNDVPYNMYLHTSPCDGRDYYYYHWHIELLPKTAIWAGFELGTGIEISTIEPEKAAQYLRRKLSSA
ncbi:MAG: galactose-1-phosphate uridylyltransferase [Candidatus Moranbacteria bacterium]|nr:galactose-1-phosphate uridylyltransferase [Candidatus Moranbacteria bacterium]